MIWDQGYFSYSLLVCFFSTTSLWLLFFSNYVFNHIDSKHCILGFRQSPKPQNTQTKHKGNQMQSIKLTPNLAWGLVILGGIVECFWASGLKYSDNLFAFTLTGIGIFISFISMILAVKVLEIGIAYSVFVGIGTAGITLAEILIFNEPFSPLKILFIATLLVGVIGLKLSSSEKEEAQEEKLVSNFSHDLGLDTILEEEQK